MTPKMGSVTALALGAQHTCALASTGTVACWGMGGRGQLGTGAYRTQLTPVNFLMGEVRSIAARGDTTCIIKARGDVYCWGYGGDGNLGDGAVADSTRPVPIMKPAPAGR